MSNVSSIVSIALWFCGCIDQQYSLSFSILSTSWARDGMLSHTNLRSNAHFEMTSTCQIFLFNISTNILRSFEANVHFSTSNY